MSYLPPVLSPYLYSSNISHDCFLYLVKYLIFLNYDLLHTQFLFSSIKVESTIFNLNHTSRDGQHIPTRRSLIPLTPHPSPYHSLPPPLPPPTSPLPAKKASAINSCPRLLT
jgi:hypothetical protein